ncbi:hypothetical protein Ddye_029616 [Dipteronia dyeriana]|uniref:NAC domain-containing protein n=1 Tax=Dipteronia dyeriana TaxID=168575 RepID=A0AAD9TER4_9ROSI|nr:hypothetical protein Ddye_029616 [Dipteronia dyeriana]
MQVDAPLGFRFRPSDEELVKDYLLKKVRGQQFPWNGVQICDLYGDKPPWEIFLHGTDHELLEKDHKFYVFTKLKKAGQKRVSRVAGCGTWHGDKRTVMIYADKKNKSGLIGFKKNFTFKVKNGSKKSHWIMHEFSLAGESLMGIDYKSCDFVLCRLKKNGVKQEASFVDNLVNPFVETLNFNPKIGGDFYDNELAVASSSQQQQQPVSVSFSCFEEKSQAGYDTLEDFYRSAMETGIPHSEFRLGEISSPILQFNTREQNLLPWYGQESSPITLESGVFKFEFESTTNPDVLMPFNSTEVVDWNNISGIGSGGMQMDDNLLPMPIHQEGNVNEEARVVIEPELPCFESVVEDWSFLNGFQQPIQGTGTDQVERSCLESNAEDGFVASMIEEYLMNEKEWSNFSMDFGELKEGYGEQNAALSGRMPCNYPIPEAQTTPGPFASGLTRDEGTIHCVGVSNDRFTDIDFAWCQEERSLTDLVEVVISVAIVTLVFNWYPFSSGKDNLVKLWDAKSGRELVIAIKIRCFVSSGTRMVTGC